MSPAGKPEPPKTQVLSWDSEMATFFQQYRHQYHSALAQDPLFAPHADLTFDSLEKLGEGGMGQVYRVLDRRLGREAALKLLSPAHQHKPVAVKRFLREAQLTARLDHPSIPPVFELGKSSQGQLYMLMRVIEGQDLRSKIDDLHQRDQLSEALPELLDILAKVCEALAYAHSQGIVHRDIKPSNIMVGQFGEVMLMDWGLASDQKTPEELEREELSASALEELDSKFHRTQNGIVLGTPGFMSPEQARGERADMGADVFALGALLTYMLTQSCPVLGRDPKIMVANAGRGAILSPLSLAPEVPTELNRLAMEAMAPEREERLSSAEQFLLNLRAYLAGEPLPLLEYSRGQNLQRWLRRHPGWVLGGVGASLTVCVLLFLSVLVMQAQSAKKRLAAQLSDTRAQQRVLEAQVRGRRQAMKYLSEAQSLAERGARAEFIVRRVQEALAQGGRQRDHLLMGGRILLKVKELDLSEELLKECYERFPKNSAALYLLHRIELERSQQPDRLQRFSGALEKLIERSDKEHFEDQYSLFARGVKAQAAGDDQSALRYYQAIEEHSRSFAFMYYNRAQINRRLGKLREAVADCSLAIQHAPTMSEAYLSRSLLLQAAGGSQDLVQARRDLDWAIQYQPTNWLAYSSRAVMNFKEDRWQQCMADFDRVFELNPGCLDAYINRGLCFSQRRLFQKALDDFNAAITTRPDSWRAHYNKALALRSMGRAEEALESVGKAALGAPASMKGVLLYQRGQILRMLKRRPEALACFEEFLAMAPGHRLAARAKAAVTQLRQSKKRP